MILKTTSLGATADGHRVRSSARGRGAGCCLLQLRIPLDDLDRCTEHDGRLDGHDRDDLRVEHHDDDLQHHDDNLDEFLAPDDAREVQVGRARDLRRDLQGHHDGLGR